MKKTRYFGLRLTEDQEKYLMRLAQEKGYSSLGYCARQMLFGDMNAGSISNATEFENSRLERRSISIRYDDWQEIIVLTKGLTSVSQFIREAIREKMSKKKS